MNYKILVSLFIFNIYHVTLPMQSTQQSPQKLLFNAIYKDDIDKVEQLLNQGVDVNIRHWTSNDTPLIIAAGDSSLAVINTLLKHGADATLKNNADLTALHKAARSHNYHLMETLILAGSDVNAHNVYGNTPLMDLIKYHHSQQDEIAQNIERLLNLGTDLNWKNVDGETALHLAVKNDDLPVLKILLAKRPDPFIKNNQGQTAADIALNENIKQMIQQYQASYKDRKNLRALTERLKEKRTKQGKTGDDYGQLIKIASEYL